MIDIIYLYYHLKVYKPRINRHKLSPVFVIYNTLDTGKKSN